MNLGMSGFTPSGYPKAVPLALAERGKEHPFKVNVWTVLPGPEIDTAMVKAGIVGNRMPYQTDKNCRTAINNGQIRYLDTHISTFNQMARFGFLPEHRDVDVAIIEACSIKDLGKGKIGIIPTTSLGGSCGYVQSAKKVIIEVNVTQPLGLEGMHDCYVPLDPPYRKIGSAPLIFPAIWRKWQPSFPVISPIPLANWRPSPMTPGLWGATW